MFYMLFKLVSFILNIQINILTSILGFYQKLEVVRANIGLWTGNQGRLGELHPIVIQQCSKYEGKKTSFRRLAFSMSVELNWKFTYSNHIHNRDNSSVLKTSQYTQVVLLVLIMMCRLGRGLYLLHFSSYVDLN